MRVALVSPNFYPKAGGVESHLIELLRSLRGVKFSVLTNWRPGIEKAYSLFPDVDFYFGWPADRPIRRWFVWSRIAMAPYRGLRASLEILRTLNRRNWLRRIDADIFHFHHIDLDQADRIASRLGMARALPRWYRWATEPADDEAKTLLTDHTVFTAPEETVPEGAKRALLETFANVVSVDAESFEVVKAFQRGRGGRAWFIPNSVDTNRFRNHEQNHHGFVVGYAARAGKSGDDLLESLIRRLGTEVRWRFALAGEEHDVRTAPMLKAAPRGDLCFNLSYLQMQEFYPTLDLLVNPFPGEGVGRTTLEAMSCGVPVIGVGTGDKYPIINGKTGYLLPPDPDLVAHTIQELVRSPEVLSEMGRQARSLIVSEFSNDVVLPKLRSVYGELSKAA